MLGVVVARKNEGGLLESCDLLDDAEPVPSGPAPEVTDEDDEIEVRTVEEVDVVVRPLSVEVAEDCDRPNEGKRRRRHLLREVSRDSGHEQARVGFRGLDRRVVRGEWKRRFRRKPPGRFWG